MTFRSFRYYARKARAHRVLTDAVSPIGTPTIARCAAGSAAWRGSGAPAAALPMR